MIELLLTVGLSNALSALLLAIFARLVGVGFKRPHLADLLWLLVFVKLVTQRRMRRFAILMFIMFASLLSSSADAQVLLNEAGEFGPEPSSEIYRFGVEMQQMPEVPTLRASFDLTQGEMTLRVTDPDGDLIYGFTGDPVNVMQPLTDANRAGVYHVEIVPEQAVGRWSVRITTAPTRQQVAGYLASGAGMVWVGIGAVLLWKLWSGCKYSWFWIGAGVWTVGVGLKFGWAFLLNKPVLDALRITVPHDAYLVLSGIYIGLLTGVFEIGITLVAALRWKQIADDRTRGVAVGVGAGAFEAMVLGMVALMGTSIAIAVGGSLRDDLVIAMAPLERTTALTWLVGPVERVIAILCHTASRTLVLFGVARGRWLWPFVAGFLVMTYVDSVAGYIHLTGLADKISAWWVELALAPAAVLSIPVIVWCIRRWPRPS